MKSSCLSIVFLGAALIAIVLNSCSGNDKGRANSATSINRKKKMARPVGCDFRSAYFTMTVPGFVKRQNLTDCFHEIRDEKSALTEIKGDTLGNRFVITYKDAQPEAGENTALLDLLSFRFDKFSSEYTKDKGWTIIKYGKTDSLDLVFQDPLHSENSGVIRFRKTNDATF